MTPHRHLVIGLTGNLGAGKSTVGRIAGQLGARAIDSDQTVRDLLANDPELAANIQNAFGAEVMLDGRPDRAALARIVFNGQAALARLEELIYPRVGQRTGELLAEPTAAPATVIEAIKIVEGPNVERLNALWIVRLLRPTLQVERAVGHGTNLCRRGAPAPGRAIKSSTTKNACSMRAGPDVRYGESTTAPTWMHCESESPPSGAKRWRAETTRRPR